MNVSLPASISPAYAIAPRALRRWASERLQRQPRADGGTVYTFALSGSTCNNRSLEALLSVAIGADGRIEHATARPAPDDHGCDTMCSANCSGRRFLDEFGNCKEAVGLTLDEAAFRDWHADPSGCFCTAAHRRHKWRSVFQTLHYAVTTLDI